MSMKVNDYINTESVVKTFARFNTTWKSSKESGFELFKAILSDAFNAGWMAMMNFKKDTVKKTMEDTAMQLTDEYLPSSFGRGEACSAVAKSIIERITVNSRNNILNVGYETTLLEPIREALQTVYAIGITSGFEIANDPAMKELYLLSSDRFAKVK